MKAPQFARVLRRRGDVATAIVYHARFLSPPDRGGWLAEHG
jgi:hypothetical protein